jgi:hypothetical protein
MDEGGEDQRERAWIALSDLFRDTEMTASDIAYLARCLREAEIGPADAEAILRDEVAPVFGWNLLSVAGNWTGWMDEDVVELVSQWLARRDAPSLAGLWHRSLPARWLRRKIFFGLVQPAWRRTLAAMREFETIPD